MTVFSKFIKTSLDILMNVSHYTSVLIMLCTICSLFHSFSFSNHFILVKVMVDFETYPRYNDDDDDGD